MHVNSAINPGVIRYIHILHLNVAHAYDIFFGRHQWKKCVLVQLHTHMDIVPYSRHGPCVLLLKHNCDDIYFGLLFFPDLVGESLDCMCDKSATKIDSCLMQFVICRF